MSLLLQLLLLWLLLLQLLLLLRLLLLYCGHHRQKDSGEVKRAIKLLHEAAAGGMVAAKHQLGIVFVKRPDLAASPQDKPVYPSPTTPRTFSRSTDRQTLYGRTIRIRLRFGFGCPNGRTAIRSFSVSHGDE